MLLTRFTLPNVLLFKRINFDWYSIKNFNYFVKEYFCCPVDYTAIACRETLKVIESVMGLDSGSVQDCFAIARGDMLSPFSDTDVEAHTNRKLGDLAMYQNVLITALDDEVITDDEMAMLDVLRRVLRLQSDEHALMVEQIRLLASRSNTSERLTERMERYLVRHPFS